MENRDRVYREEGLLLLPVSIPEVVIQISVDGIQCCAEQEDSADEADEADEEECCADQKTDSRASQPPDGHLYNIIRPMLSACTGDPSRY